MAHFHTHKSPPLRPILSWKRCDCFNKIQMAHGIISHKQMYRLLLSDSNRNWNVYEEFSKITLNPLKCSWVISHVDRWKGAIFTGAERVCRGGGRKFLKINLNMARYATASFIFRLISEINYIKYVSIRRFFRNDRQVAGETFLLFDIPMNHKRVEGN
jgi:hypothetical protein